MNRANNQSEIVLSRKITEGTTNLISRTWQSYSFKQSQQICSRFSSIYRSNIKISLRFNQTLQEFKNSDAIKLRL